ncbi:MAG: DUF1599 domain-containing protein [Flavobacteriaceae bacterium]|jgi:hypothetical protein|nr:DUF1599 domain-containing protein [Flavobacteriaceae bacterium]
MEKTSQQFDSIILTCKRLFKNKMLDYGAAWRILRLPSLTDQVYIKANRIRTIQEKGEQKVQENIEGEFTAIINYSIMALIQLEKGVAEQPDLNIEEASELFDKKAAEAKNLMNDKNHDYGEAWRDLRISSITDLILQKLLRIKQIEDNKGKTLVSEGLDANYYDILNYAVFALILLQEKSQKTIL